MHRPRHPTGRPPRPLPLRARVLLALGPVLTVLLFPPTMLLYACFWVHERVRLAIVGRRG